MHKNKLDSYNLKQSTKEKSIYRFNKDIKIFFDTNDNVKSISIKKNIFYINKLKKNIATEDYPLSLIDLSYLFLGTKKFIVMQTSYNVNINALNSQSMTFVFEVLKNGAVFVNFPSSNCSDLICFGDFDDDKNLDYLYLVDTNLKILSYKGKNIIEGKKYNLKIIDNKEISNEYSILFIDIKQSKWFFELRKAWDKFLTKK